VIRFSLSTPRFVTHGNASATTSSARSPSSARRTSITVGTGRAAVAGADGVVRDDSWMEVFEAASGRVAIVQASGPDHPDALTRALEYPDADDEDGGTLNVSSGMLRFRDGQVQPDTLTFPTGIT
jgi:hypothetical protein